jgi:hypothetical protein
MLPRSIIRQKGGQRNLDRCTQESTIQLRPRVSLSFRKRKS